MEEDEENRLLSSLGIASENPEDIERRILEEGKGDEQGGSNVGEGSEGGGRNETDPSSSDQIKLYNKLRAVEVEIGAVSSTIEKGKSVVADENESSDNEDTKRDKDDGVEVNHDGLTLQQALAEERLESLKRVKAQIQKEISNFNGDVASTSNANGNVATNDVGHKGLFDRLVEEKDKNKGKSKATKNASKSSKMPRRKNVVFDEDTDFDAILDAAASGFVETGRDELIRKGLLTPFHQLKGFERRVQQAGPSQSHVGPEEVSISASSIAKVNEAMAKIAEARPATKLLDQETVPKLEGPTIPFKRLNAPLKRPSSPSTEKPVKKKRKLRRPLPDKKWRKDKVIKKKSKKRNGRNASGNSVSDGEEETDEELNDADDDEQTPVILEGGLKIPGDIYSQLFDYQKVGVQWLWELHCQKAGGIIGDEMGLGKTIQVLSFLGALHFSKKYKPSIVICPVTLLHQWQREADKWYPEFDVQILHDSAANGQTKQSHARSSDSDSVTEESRDSDNQRPQASKSKNRWDELIDRVVTSESGLLLTTYDQVRIHGQKLLNIGWGYAVLDEGHKIRNPNAEVTMVCKQLRTLHRVIMTGAPIQNKLSELWSLFDFVFPGKLGVLPVFESEFAVPITVGGYVNATPLQVSTAYRCAVVLRDLIMPYLLRRMKADVNAHLTKKTEHVLFCSLTTEQRSVYRSFLASSDVEAIFDGSRNSLYGIDIMRKICNHPDLLEREHAAENPDYGNPERSGKMKVVAQVSKVWKDQGHRVLLFTQTQQMLDILEKFFNKEGYTYRRMDGLTPVKQRMALIDEFNNTSEIFIFILTTKVGGLGTNLTGANRVIIFDPDWNPSTDMQARERAWRIGQTRDVTVYRLITRGTIEEKVYHRQIYKHFLTNKILKNPQQKRFFKSKDMRDLYVLQDDGDKGSTETSNIFRQLSEDVNVGLGVGVDPSVMQESSQPELQASTSSSNGGQSNGENYEESNILKCLFDAQGLSAVNHDAIVNCNEEDKVRMEEQASRVAQRAAEALRESRMLRSRESFAVPTWTGRNGTAGAPSSARPKFGSSTNSQLLNRRDGASSSRNPTFHAGAPSGRALSSSEVLNRIRGRQQLADTDALEQDLMGRNQDARRTSVITQPEVLVRQLCTFIQQRGGQADSASITQHFKDRIQSKDLALFKSLLKEIAVLEKSANGTRWVLKPDYR